MSSRTDRINELAKKEKTVGLTDEEKAEQKRSACATSSAPNSEKISLCSSKTPRTPAVKNKKTSHKGKIF